MTTEKEWIQQARSGDQIAFGRLVQAYQKPVYNLSYRMLGNAAEAEEASQEAFLRAYTHLRSYDPKRSFSTWLMSIASHYCIDQLRRRRLTWLSFEDEIAAPENPIEGTTTRLASEFPNPETMVARKEREVYIQRLLSALSPTDRAAVTLLYWYDHSYEEIAETLDLTVSAVKSRLYRARRALAELLEEDGGNDETYELRTSD